MATAAEPKPAELPLAGGAEGAAVRVHPLLTGTMKGPAAWFLKEEGRLATLHALGFGIGSEGWIRVPVPAFLVEHPGAGAILIDTGLHASIAVEPRKNLGRLGTVVFRGIEMSASQAVAAQLRDRGIDPAQVRTIVMTHLHLDHASAMSDFPEATFVFSRREWEAATTQGPLHGYVKRQFDHAFDYRTVDFEGGELDSYETFGRGVDLLGDGSIRLVYTPGHTLGHLSVLLRMRERDFLACGDAAYTRETLRSGHMPARTEDDHVFRRSLRELQLYMEQHPDTVAVPGHDMAAWDELAASYE